MKLEGAKLKFMEVINNLSRAGNSYRTGEPTHRAGLVEQAGTGSPSNGVCR